MNDSPTSKRKGCPISCMVYCFAITFLVIGILYAILLINNRPPHIKVPPQKLPKPNAWDTFVKAGNMLPNGSQIELGPVSSTRSLNSWTLPECEQFMRANARALAEFRKGLGKPYMHPRPKSIEQLSYTHLAHFRELARRLSSEALYYQKINRYDLAAESAIDAIELGNVIPKGDGQIGLLVGTAIKRIGIVRLEPILPKLSSVNLKHAAQRLNQINTNHWTFSDAMNEQARTDAVLYAIVYSESKYRSEAIDPRKWISVNPIKEPNQAWTNIRGAFYCKQTAVLEIKRYDEAVAKEQRGFYTGKSNIPLPQNPITRGYAYYKKVVISARTTDAASQAYIALLQTEIALHLYKLDNGIYPSRPADLAPRYLKKVPVDPFGLGKSLHYKSLKGGKDFLLYSLGPNLRDDSGVVGKWDGAKTPGDLVAGKL